MFAICLESSHKKGMGHLYRMLNFIKLLEEKHENYFLIINEDNITKSILNDKNIITEIVDLNNYNSGWETFLIEKYEPNFWINDRLNTDIRHSTYIKKREVRLITFDDTGTGAELADINFGTMPCNYNKAMNGKKVYRGIDYFILNKEIERFRRIRKKTENIVVTLGGSDTYGVTLKIISFLIMLNQSATIIIGPAFKHFNDLKNIKSEKIVIKYFVPSLIEEFYNFDLAITGGGITPFEASASGLPCLIIANEQHEVENGMFLQKLGSSKFVGFYENINSESFVFDTMNIMQMSMVGIEEINLNGSENIYNKIIGNE